MPFRTPGVGGSLPSVKWTANERFFFFNICPFFFFGSAAWLAEYQFPNQALNPQAMAVNTLNPNH